MNALVVYVDTDPGSVTMVELPLSKIEVATGAIVVVAVLRIVDPSNVVVYAEPVTVKVEAPAVIVVVL